MHIRASVAAALAVVACAGNAAGAVAAAKERTGWERVSPAAAGQASFTLDREAVEEALDNAPRERTAAARERPARVAIPRPDGSLEEFEVVESPVMEPALQARHPDIRTYAGRAADDATRTVRLDLSPLGFNASVHGEGGRYAVRPHEPGSDVHVASSADANLPGVSGAAAGLDDALENHAPAGKARKGHPPDPADGMVGLRVYRLALLSEHRFAEFARDPEAPAGPGYRTTAAKVTLVNRTNLVFERDWAARLLLIDATDDLNLDTAQLATGPGGPCGDLPCFTEQDLVSCSGVLARSTDVIGVIAGARNYDIGHTLTGHDGGGIAYIPAGGGCSGSRWVDSHYQAMVFAHELGHQFGAPHTWSRCFNLAGGANGVEPGSGVTILGYAGVCLFDNVQNDSEPYFSHNSLAAMQAAAEAVHDPVSSVQDIRFTGFGDGDSYRLTYRDGASVPITVADHTSDGIKAVIEDISSLPDGSTVSVGYVDEKAIVIEFGGALAGVPVDLLGVEDATGVEVKVGERVVGGVPTNGGRVEVTDNHHPVVTAPAEVSIPLRTPFELTAQAVDRDHADALTYMWEQTDGSENGSHSLTEQNKVRGPLFSAFGTRSPRVNPWPGHEPYPPTLQGHPSSSPTRSFPDRAQVRANDTNAQGGRCPITNLDCNAEMLPTSAYIGTRGDRTMGFRVTVRDNHPGAGGTAYDDTLVRIDPSAGPFRVTAPAAPTTLPAGAGFPVTWSVAGTDSLADKVSIKLSLDGGETFPVTLAVATPNDGLAVVEIPASERTTQGVIRVGAVGGPWFDLGRGFLTIQDAVLVPETPSLAFGSMKIGNPGSERIARVRNAGDDELALGTVALEGADADAFTVSADDCSGQTLPPGESCKVRLRFSPLRTGESLAQLSVSSDDGVSSLRIPLTGEGRE